MQWGFGPFRRCRRRRPIRLDEIGVSLRIATTGADPPDTVGDLDSLDGVLGERLGWVLCHGDRLRCRRLIGSLNSAPGSRCVAGRSGAERQSAQGHAVEGEPETAHQDEGGQHVDGMALPIISVRRRLPRNRYATSTASTAPPSAADRPANVAGVLDVFAVGKGEVGRAASPHCCAIAPRLPLR